MPLLTRISRAGLGRRRLQRLYVVAAASLAALVPLILFAGFWIRSELNKSQHDIELFLGARASALSQRVDAEIHQQLSALRAISTLPTLDSNVEQFETSANRIASAMPHWTGLALVDANTGQSVFSSRPDTVSRATDAFVRRAREERRPIVEAQPDAFTKGGGVVLYFPVVRDGIVNHVLMATIDGRDIEALVEQQGQVSTLLSVILDGNDRILARSIDPSAYIGREAGPLYRAAHANHDSGFFQGQTQEGEAVSSAFIRSSLTGWTSVVSISKRQSDRLSTRSIWATIAAGALSLVLACILGVFIIHNVMERRVSDERLAASRALGDLDARLLATTQEALHEQRKASSEREVLLREIYHRVKNNLQIVQSLLRLGSRDLKPDQREPFENAVRRIGAMARVHTLLYNSPDLASIDFKDYLDELLKELSEGFSAEERKIEAVLQSDAMPLSLDTAVPLAFIAVEILTNSYKHAFPNGRPGRISVEVSRTDGQALLKIEDDGIGLTPAESGRRHLGLTIVRKLVQQIGGTLEEPASGSSVFVVKFPIEPSGERKGSSSAERETESTAT